MVISGAKYSCLAQIQSCYIHYGLFILFKAYGSKEKGCTVDVVHSAVVDQWDTRSEAK